MGNGWFLMSNGRQIGPTAPAVAGEANDGGMFHTVKAYPVVRKLWIGTIATNTAFWMYQVALGWLALDLTDSPLFVGLAGFFFGIPMLILALPSGVVIDRFPRRNVLLTAQVALLIVAGVFAFMIYADLITRFWILALAAAYGGSMSFVFPTRQAIIPNLVDKKDISNAVALNAAGQNATRVTGPALAGLLIGLVGTPATFAVAAGLQLIAFAMTLPLPPIAPAPSTGARPGLIASVAEGLQYVIRDRLLTGIMLMATIATVFIMPYLNLMPVFARDELDVGSRGFGFMMACAGAGSVIGALGIAASRRFAGTSGFQALACAGFAISVLIFSQTPWFLAATALLLATGLTSAAFLAVNMTVLVTRAPEEVRGRVLSINSLTWGLLPVGQLPIGWLADRTSAPLATSVACSIAVILILVLIWRIPDMRPGADPPVPV
jgi:MFS family permease